MSKGFEVEWFGRQFFVSATEANLTAMKKAGFILERVAKKLMIGGSKRGRKGLVHIPSSPGEPPRVRTGILRASISTEILQKPTNIQGFVGSDINKISEGLAREGVTATKTGVEYGYFLEVGTRFMKKRPWLRPALMKSSKMILKIFRNANKT